MNFIEKYRPQNSSELIVSPRIISDIRNWIKLWKEGTPVKKALILYGPPGTGKTTTASVLAKEMNVPIVEMNASDQRNADAMKRIALMASLYGDLSQIDSSQSGFNKIILIDEADNIFEGKSRETGGDSGGLTELSRVVSRTMNPIILTMNDYYAFRRKNSAREIINNSLVIEYRQYRRKGDNEYKLFRSRIIERIREIASKENMRFNTDAIERLVDKNSDDIRSTINDTMSVLSYADDPGPSGEASVRDIQSSIYDVVHTTFKDRNYEKTLFQLYEKDFTTEDYLMWIDENLHSEAPDLNDLSEAYDLLSLSDSFIGRVLKKQHYAFKGYAEELAAGIFNRIEHPNQKYVKYEFPSYIMKMSRLRDARESRKSAVSKLSRFTHSGKLRTSSMLWFFSDFLKSKANLAGLSDKLLLSEKEISVLKRR